MLHEFDAAFCTHILNFKSVIKYVINELAFIQCAISSKPVNAIFETTLTVSITTSQTNNFHCPTPRLLTTCLQAIPIQDKPKRNEAMNTITYTLYWSNNKKKNLPVSKSAPISSFSSCYYYQQKLQTTANRGAKTSQTTKKLLHWLYLWIFPEQTASGTDGVGYTESEMLTILSSLKGEQRNSSTKKRSLTDGFLALQPVLCTYLLWCV